MSIRQLARLLLFSAVFLGSTTSIALAQDITGDILGTVTDPNGGAVQGAKVTIQNLETQAIRTSETGSQGDYTFSLLSPGHYALNVEAAGFKVYKVERVELSAGDRTRLDAHLQVGDVNQTVEVTAAAPLLQTDSSSVSSTVPEAIIQDIPLNGRNLTNLVTQQVGVTAGTPNSITGGSRPDDRRQTSTVSANGQLDYFNNNMVDGIDNNERFYGLTGVKPSIEGIQEINVQTNNYPAAVGRAAGAVVEVLTKSGTNQFHGSLFEYFRNDIFDAKDFFTPAGAPTPEWRQNQFGGSVGGPIRKDKTFFFFDIEQYRIVQGITSPEQTVPSIADRQLVAGLPNSIGKELFELYPLPNVPGTNFYVSTPARTQNNTTLDSRVDEHFSANDSLFVRYSYNPVTSFFPAFFPEVNGINAGGSGFIANGNFPGTNSTTAQGAQVNYTHIFSPNVVMELRAGFMRLNIDSEPINKGTNASSKLGIPNANLPGDQNSTGFTAFHFLDGSADLGDQIAYPIHNINNTYQINGDVIYTRGAHSLKMGAALIRRQVNYLQEFEPEGWFFFLSPVAMAEGVPAVVALRQNMYSPEYLRTWEPSAYVQDDWHVNSWLTLNLGVRYDVFTPFTDARNRLSNFDLNTLQFNIGGTGGVKTDYGDVAPRFGFAAQLGHNLVLRGGFGMSYYPGDFAGVLTLFNPPFNNPVSCSPIAGTCAGGVGFLQTGPPISPAYVNPSIIYSASAGGLNLVSKQTGWRASYLEQYNLTLQKQIGANALTAAYVGSVGRRQAVPSGEDLNLPQPDANGTIDLVGGSVPSYYAQQLPGVSELQFYQNEATSNYNSMQLNFARRQSNGLTFNANYTWAHGLNNWSGFESGGAPATWRDNRAYDYGSSDLDIRQRFAITLAYNLPFGKSLTGAKAALVKGWSLNSSAFWQTGLPFTVNDSNKPPGAYQQIAQGLRVNTVVGQNPYAANPSVNGWLNPAAFTPPALTATTFTLGDEGSNQFVGPHTRQIDFSAIKNFPIRETINLQFRAECYNVSNTPNFAQPVAVLNSVSFGQILSTQFGSVPRVFQFALKLTF